MPARAQVDEPVNVLHRTWQVVPAAGRQVVQGHLLPRNPQAERDTLASWINDESWKFGFNRTFYALDRDFFEKVSALSACRDSCGGIWPRPPLNGTVHFEFDSRHEGWLVDLSPFRGQNPYYERVRTWFNAGRLTDVFDRRLCREDPLQRGLLAGESSGCTCSFTYDEVLGYLREQLQHVRDKANALESDLFEETVRGMHFNFENYAFPRYEYDVAPGQNVRFHAYPGVCLATGREFNATDFGPPEGLDHNAGTNGALPGTPPLDFDLFLSDVEFDYPALMITSAGGPSGQIAFGDPAANRWAVSQSFVITNAYVSRVDVKLSRISSTTFPSGYLYYTLAKANQDGTPNFNVHTTPRGARSWWIPHVDESQRGWISFYIDPQESANLFSKNDDVAFVLFLKDSQSGDVYYVDKGPSVSGSAYVVNTGGSLPPSSSGTVSVDDIEHQVWYATRTDRSAHDDWVTFQNRRVGDVLRDIKVRAFGVDDGTAEDMQPGTPTVELWPFAHAPDREFAGMSARELWGSDIGENHNGIGTAAQVDGIQSGYMGNIAHAQSLYSGGVKPTSYQVTDTKDEPDYDPGNIHWASKWAFAFGGLSVFSRSFAPGVGADYEDWKDAQYPKLHAWTAPRRLFPEHYQWVHGGGLPDVVPGTVYTLSAPCPIYPDGTAGHVLVANDGGTPVTIDLVDHVPSGWRTVQSTWTMNVDVATVYHQQEFDHHLVPHDTFVLCHPDEEVTYTLEELGDEDFGSLVVARYHTPSVQPGRFVPNKPGGSYCTDHAMTVKWHTIPEACIEQHGLEQDGVRVSIDFQVFTPTEADPVPAWRHLYTPVRDSEDDGEEVIDVCGPYPPSTANCPMEHYGKDWRARLTFCTPLCGQHYSEPLFRTYSSTFTVFPEYEGACNTTGGCPYVGVATTNGHAMDNNVLAYSGDGTPVVDHYRLRVEPALLDSIYHLTLSETASDVSIVDSVSIVIVDHPESTRVAVAHDGAIYGFTDVRPPLTALATDGSDVTSLFAVEGDTLDFHGYAGDHVTLDLGVADSTSALYVVSDIKLVPEEAPLSILLQVPDPTAEWTTVKRLEPRDLWGEDVLPLSTLGYAPGDSVRVRLFWTAEHKVDAVGLLSGEAGWTATEVPVGWAYHTTLGEVTASLRNDDLDQIALAQGDVVLMEFPADTVATGQVRDVVLVTDGLWTGSGGIPARQSQAPAGTRPALRVIGPRPLRGAVTLRFELPADADVAVRVFDVQGRQVRTVVAGRREAGRHLVAWDLRDARGSMLGAGVYFARLDVDGTAVTSEKLHVVR